MIAAAGGAYRLIERDSRARGSALATELALRQQMRGAHTTDVAEIDRALLELSAQAAVLPADRVAERGSLANAIADLRARKARLAAFDAKAEKTCSVAGVARTEAECRTLAADGAI